MSTHDRYVSDNLFELGFASMERGDYKTGLDTIRTAAGADQFEWDPDKDYDPAVGIEHLSEIKMAADGVLDENGEYSPGGDLRPHASALVFMAAHEEYRGFIERRTGKSPDYRAQGFINHLGHAIALYRRAEALGYPMATWRIDALKLKMGSSDFQIAEDSYAASAGRARAYQTDLANQIMANLGSERRFDTPQQENAVSQSPQSTSPPGATAPAVSAQDVRNVRFMVVRRGEGFDMGQVDRFLNNCEQSLVAFEEGAAYPGPRALLPMALRSALRQSQRAFGRNRLREGYDKREVLAVVGDVAKVFDRWQASSHK